MARGGGGGGWQVYRLWLPKEQRSPAEACSLSALPAGMAGEALPLAQAGGIGNDFMPSSFAISSSIFGVFLFHNTFSGGTSA